MENVGLEKLRKKLEIKRIRVRTRYAYYEMKQGVEHFSKLLPTEFRWLKSCLGWSAKAVDSLADRLSFREFKNDTFYLNEIYLMNNPDVLYDSAITGALISACDFIYISQDEDGFPRLQVIDGGNATGIIDPITGLLNEGYAVLERNNNDAPTIEAYFTKEYTAIYRSGEREPAVYNNPTGYVLLVPIIYRPDARRPFGHSRISRACMSIQQEALRTLRRAEISGEFYSVPQRYALGLDPEAEFNGQAATWSMYLGIDKDADGDHPVLGQFQQMSMTPFTEQIKMFASLFAGETGLTLDDLGFVAENPSSAEAIKASHENLRLTARKAQKQFGSGFLNAGLVAASLRDGVAYDRYEFMKTVPSWEPIFEPDAAMLSGIGDALIKLNQAHPGYVTDEKLRELLGF